MLEKVASIIAIIVFFGGVLKGYSNIIIRFDRIERFIEEHNKICPSSNHPEPQS